MCVYGDPAYPLSVHLQTGFRNPANREEENFNQSMSAVRVAVEWVFGDVIERFRRLQKDDENWFEPRRQTVCCFCSTVKCQDMFVWLKHIIIFQLSTPSA